MKKVSILVLLALSAMGLAAQNQPLVYVHPSAQSEAFGYDTCNFPSTLSYYSVCAVKGGTFNVPEVSVEASKTTTLDLSVFNKDRQPSILGKYTLVSSASRAELVDTKNNTVSFKITGQAKDSRDYYFLIRAGKIFPDTLMCLAVNTFEPKTEKIVLVPTNGAAVTQEYVAQLKSNLDRVFKPTVIKWDITIGAPFTVDGWDLENDGLALTSGENTKEMKAIISAYKKANKPERKVNYLFVVPTVNSNLKVSWVRGSSFGFTAPSIVDRSLFNQIGGGIFKLDDIANIIPEGTTSDNLMDAKGTGTVLIKPQWDQVR